DYGRPFAEIFKAYEYDFFKVDPMLFSPARVVISVLDSGRSFTAGSLDRDLLTASFGVAP
ncbi:MAG: methenyltetrahydromethanopterin cyclohydrolase, partial [Candidatus Thiodiazotropha taylori]